MAVPNYQDNPYFHKGLQKTYDAVNTHSNIHLGVADKFLYKLCALEEIARHNLDPSCHQEGYPLFKLRQATAEDIAVLDGVQDGFDLFMERYLPDERYYRLH